MKIEQKWEYVLLDDMVRLGINDQTDLIRWMWQNRPELVVEVITDSKERMNMFCREQSDKEQRWFLSWMSKHNPELLKEYADKLK